jgi:hypothetical protein
MDTNNKKEFLIVFLDDHLTYSPTTLNLFYTLKRFYNVELISARQPAYYSKNEVNDLGIKYLDFVVKRTFIDFIKLIYYKIFDKLIKPTKDELEKRKLPTYRTKDIIKYLKNTDKEIITIDTAVQWCAQQAGKQAHMVSLEIFEDDIYLKNLNLNSIKSLIIQSEERLNYLFPEEKPKYFIIQNAPERPDFVPEYEKRNKTDLIYCGSAVAAFGIITCLDFIKDYKNYTLTIKGAFPEDTERIIQTHYHDLLTEKRLIIDDKYLTADELNKYVSKFRIGFAFYDFYRFSHLRTFNYYTAPSGKVFQYLNSGVPIIANALPGFEFIKKNNCGELISHLSSIQIKAAIDAIELDYLNYAVNATKTAEKYDFSKMVQPFLDFVKQ